MVNFRHIISVLAKGSKEQTPAKAIERHQANDQRESENSGFIRNSGIRLSDTRVRRSIRESPKTESEQTKEPQDAVPVIIPTAQTVEAALPKAPEPLKTENSGFVRNSSIRLSDTRTRRSVRETKPDLPKVTAPTEVVVAATTGEVEEVKKTEERESAKMEESSDVDDDYRVYSLPFHQKNEVSSTTEVKNTNESPPPPKEERAMDTEPSTSKILVEPIHTASNNKGKEDSDSSRSAIPYRVGEQVRPDPIGGAGSTSNHELSPSDGERDREKAVPKEAEEETSDDGTSENSKSIESTESSDSSEDSARGDSILPTLDDSLYLSPRKHPRFVLMDPLEGSTEGGYEVCLYGINLDQKVMLHAEVFVDVYAVPKEDWQVEVGDWPALAPDATHCLHIRIPPMPPGVAWIEVETISEGRLQCPRPFLFSNKASSMKYSARGMGGRKALEQQQERSIRQPAPSFMDFEFTPKVEERVAKAPSPNTAKVGDLGTAKAEIAKLYEEVSRLKLELQRKTEDEILISRQLCLLQGRLLEDGQLKYLEKF
ncbi:hypothetical protein Aperf_G00000060871 [Anoplocephala perfoliata]